MKSGENGLLRMLIELQFRQSTINVLLGIMEKDVACTA